MAEPRRLPVLGVLVCAAIAGGVLGSTGTTGPAGPGAQAVTVSEAPVAALSTSWFCAGARAEPGASDAGWLTFQNAGAQPVGAKVHLVTEQGYGATSRLKVPAGGTLTVPERLGDLPAALPGHLGPGSGRS